MSNLPEGWEEKSLGEITESKIDQGGPTSNPFTYIDISCVNNLLKKIEDPRQLPLKEAPSRARQRLKGGDVLVSMTRPNLNAVALVSEELSGSVGSTGFHILRGQGVESKWLFYTVQSSDFVRTMSGLVQGALYPAIRPKDIRKYPLAVPRQPIQRKIVSEIEKHFSRLDSALESLKRVRVQLKQYRASVLAAACSGRLVPTEAELARKAKRTYEPASELLKRILHERRSRWEADYIAKQKTKPKDDAWKKKYKEPAAPDTSELPDLPEGWCWATIDQLATETLIGIDRGREYQRIDPTSGNPYVKMNNVSMEGEIAFNEMVYVTASVDEMLRFSLRSGDILFNTRNSKELVGKVGLVRLPPANCMYNNNLMRIRLHDHVSSAFIVGQMCAHEFRRRMELVKKATTNVAAVYAKDLLPLALAIPPLPEQTRIVAEVERHLSIQSEVQDVIERKIAHAASLRQSILRHAFTGKLAQ